MNTRTYRPVMFLLLAAATLAAINIPAVRAQAPEAAGPSWQSPAVDTVRAQVFAWLDERKADAATRAKAAELWAKPETPSGLELLNRVVKTFALADDNIRALAEMCSKPRGTETPPNPAWLADPKAPAFVTKNVRLWYARWLIRENLYDDALEQLRGLGPPDVVDPASLLFCQSIADYRLSNKDEGMESLQRLLEAGDQGPRRYVTLARLMQADLKDLKEDSLDHIARRMGDIERRLDLGHGGKKVRKVEDGVIASLDKLIKEMEDKQQQSSSGAGGNSIQSSNPAADSRIIGGKGRGEVNRKNVGSGSGWGNLPPKQREEALQQIGREFPSHYRDVIEGYFRKLASEGSE